MTANSRRLLPSKDAMSPDAILRVALEEFTRDEIRAMLHHLDRLSYRDGIAWHRDTIPAHYPPSGGAYLADSERHRRNRRLAIAASALAHAGAFPASCGV